MDEKNKKCIELTSEEFDDLFAAENCQTEEEPVTEYYFSNPDPYAKVEARSDDAPRHDISFDENGNIVVKNPSAFWLPEVRITDEIGGTEYTVTGIEVQEKQIENLDTFIDRVKKYSSLEELTPYALRELVKAIYVEAPDKSSGKRKQKIHIEYDLVGFIPVDELTKAKET